MGSIQLRQNDSAKWEHDISILGFMTGDYMLNGGEKEHSISGCLLKTLLRHLGSNTFLLCKNISVKKTKAGEHI